MNSQIIRAPKLFQSIILAAVFLIRAHSFGLNTDGVILLSFKYSITRDPSGALQSWNYNDQTPCSWNGITCGAPGSGDAYFRVTGLSLPDFGLSGILPATLGLIRHLRVLNLSNNSINGSIPSSLFNATNLELLDLSDNLISGGLPDLVGRLQNLHVLNLSGNSLGGNLPHNLNALQNLTTVYLRNNYFSGSLPGGFNSVRDLDLSSNLINGSLPADFGGSNLAYFNISFNKLTGDIPPEFAAKIPVNATVDFSNNNLTGQIPDSDLFYNQQQDSFSGNPGLCGRPLKNRCTAPSSAGVPPDGSPPAIAAIPTSIGSNPAAHAGKSSPGRNAKLSTGTIVGIVIGDVAGIAILALIIVYVYKLKKRKKRTEDLTKETETANEFDWASSASSTEGHNWLPTWTCLKKQRHAGDGEDEEIESVTTTESTNSDGDETANLRRTTLKKGALVTLDGGKELELETLLRASAYILGASGSSIMYKAVLENGTVLAVRRIGENGVERFRDFENQVRVISKLVHPNLIKILGFYWGSDEKLIIYDFVPNGSLANARFRKAGTPAAATLQLGWEARLRIARGVARALCYIHEKKQVHGNLKPSNILLGLEMEPKIGDFGLERLVNGENSSKPAWNFGSKRSSMSRDSFHDFVNGPTPCPSPSPTPSELALSPYHAPESLRSLKPNPKWDVYSYGVVLLELLTGKVVVAEESAAGLPLGSSTLTEEDRSKVLRFTDVAIRGELEGKEEVLLVLLRLGFGCISPVPQKRPSIKEVLHAIERFPSRSGP